MSRTLLLFALSLMLVSCADGPTAEKTYELRCANCHGKNGEGLKKLIPPLADSDYLQSNMDQLACIIRNGMKDSIRVNGEWYVQEMPASQDLSDMDIVNLVNYINKRWGSPSTAQTPSKTRDQLKKCR